VGARKSFTIESFVSELEGIIDAIGAKTVDLLGHSFGGIVIGEYALRHPERVRKAVFASVSIDIPRWLEDAERLVNKMPLLQKMVLKEGHRSGSYGAPAYLAALSEYYTHHVYGFAGPLPDVLKLAEREADPQTYQVMWGPNEIVVSGVCRDYSLTPRLSQLACPTLFTCGRFDEATPEAHEYFRSQVANGQLRVFEKSAHHPQLSELDDYAEVLAEFLA
jgi:proline iminopeptidase